MKPKIINKVKTAVKSGEKKQLNKPKIIAEIMTMCCPERTAKCVVPLKLIAFLNSEVNFPFSPKVKPAKKAAGSGAKTF
jgi:hypothetical protein